MEALRLMLLAAVVVVVLVLVVVPGWVSALSTPW
jgi:hypothetical protein